MTNEEYQQLFPWTEYTVVARDGRLAVSFGEKPIPLSFKIGDVEFTSRAASRYATHYRGPSGILLTLRCPHPQPYRAHVQAQLDYREGEWSDVGMWVAHKEGPYSEPRCDTPMEALKLMQKWLHNVVLSGRQDQQDYDAVSALLAGE